MNSLPRLHVNILPYSLQSLLLEGYNVLTHPAEFPCFLLSQRITSFLELKKSHSYTFLVFFFNTHTHILIKYTEMFCVFVFVENIRKTPTNQYEDRQHNIKTIKRYEEVTDTSENRRTNI